MKKKLVSIAAANAKRMKLSWVKGIAGIIISILGMDLYLKAVASQGYVVGSNDACDAGDHLLDEMKQLGFVTDEQIVEATRSMWNKREEALEETKE